MSKLVEYISKKTKELLTMQMASLGVKMPDANPWIIGEVSADKKHIILPNGQQYNLISNGSILAGHILATKINSDTYYTLGAKYKIIENDQSNPNTDFIAEYATTSGPAITYYYVGRANDKNLYIIPDSISAFFPGVSQLSVKFSVDGKHIVFYTNNFGYSDSSTTMAVPVPNWPLKYAIIENYKLNRQNLKVEGNIVTNTVNLLSYISLPYTSIPDLPSLPLSIPFDEIVFACHYSGTAVYIRSAKPLSYVYTTTLFTNFDLVVYPDPKKIQPFLIDYVGEYYFSDETQFNVDSSPDGGFLTFDAGSSHCSGVPNPPCTNCATLYPHPVYPFNLNTLCSTYIVQSLTDSPLTIQENKPSNYRIIPTNNNSVRVDVPGIVAFQFFVSGFEYFVDLYIKNYSTLQQEVSEINGTTFINSWSFDVSRFWKSTFFTDSTSAGGIIEDTRAKLERSLNSFLSLFFINTVGGTQKYDIVKSTVNSQTNVPTQIGKAISVTIPVTDPNHSNATTLGIFDFHQ